VKSTVLISDFEGATSVLCTVEGYKNNANSSDNKLKLNPGKKVSHNLETKANLLKADITRNPDIHNKIKNK
jgi:hypothetical protein